MKILITGASGFVGGALWRRCLELGWEARAIGRRPLSQPGYEAHDLAEPLETCFTPDVIVHAAARSSPWGRRRDFERQNVQATENVLRFASERSCPLVIYVSTSAVLYRPEHQLGMDEDTAPPEKAVNEYARTKLAGEHRVRAYSGPWSILRPRAVFGPGDTVVFPRILNAVKRGRFPLIESDRVVWADLIYIDTLVEYIVRAASRRATGIYHLSNDQPVAILPFLGQLFQELGLAAPTRRMTATQALHLAIALEVLHRALPFLGEPPITRFGASVFSYSKTLNVSRSLRDFGPPAVGLDQAVRRFVEWQRPRL